jgi:hypothetical protein
MEMANFKAIAVRGGKTGTKIHLATPGSSGSWCGHWFKWDVKYYKVDSSTPITCDKCREHNPGALGEDGSLKIDYRA